MINREEWGNIYDWARYNGFAPVDFIVQAMHTEGLSVTANAKDENAIYEICRKFSISRTNYPSISLEEPS